ncbi:MAG: hypothetical protein C4311_10890 [Chloroflexota bacterium]
MKEARFLFIVILAVCVLSSLPYLYGYLSAPPDRVFMGILLNTPDTTQYFAWMRSFGAANLIDNKLTPEPNEAVFFNLLWWTLGKLARWGGLSLPLVYQLFRMVAAVAFLLLAYWFCGLFLPDRGQRRTAFLLIAVGSGLGWIWVVLKYLSRSSDVAYPFDVYTVEPNTFLGIMAFPHFIQAASLLLVVFALALLAFERRRLREALLAGLLAFVLGLTHAYDLLLVYAVVGAFALVLLWREGFSPRLILIPMSIVALSIWPAIYSVYITSAFPMWREVLAQFVNAGAWTPSPPHLVVLLGLPFLVALIALVLPPRSPATGEEPVRNRRELFLKTWFVINFFVVYVPLSYQIHYLNGWQVPIAILATMGFYQRVIPWLERRITKDEKPALSVAKGRRVPVFGRLSVESVLASLLIVAALPTNVYLFAWRFVDLSRYSHPYYLARDEWEALRWLDANAPPDAVVFSSADIGQYVPSATEGRAFLAHWAMTADLYRKQEIVRAFFNAAMTDAERAAVLQAYHVRYIFWGETERKLGTLNPDAFPFVRRVYVSPQAVIYQVEALPLDVGDGSRVNGEGD